MSDLDRIVIGVHERLASRAALNPMSHLERVPEPELLELSSAFARI